MHGLDARDAWNGGEDDEKNGRSGKQEVEFDENPLAEEESTN